MYRHGPIMLANFSQRFVLSDLGVKFIRDSRGNFKLQGATFFTFNLHVLSIYWHFYGMFLRCTEHNRAMPNYVWKIPNNCLFMFYI